MVEGGGGAGLAPEALEGEWIGGCAGEHLDGDMAAELEVLGFIHDTHAARAYAAEDAVVAEDGSRLWLIHEDNYAGT
jgi:hypothetical protein